MAIGETDLRALCSNTVGIEVVEPHIFSVASDKEASNEYDTRFGNVYDRVACNPVYNRVIWGYSIKRFLSFTREALTSSPRGTVLDLGCGSLAFTAEVYIRFSARPVVLVDQSIQMLRLAKSRLLKMTGKVPDNLVFLHADALHLPFRQKSIETIISLNLLHCLSDTGQLLIALKDILSDTGKMYFTTLVKSSRVADRYLDALAAGGKLVGRTIEDHRAAFSRLGISMKSDIRGNMAFLYCE